MEQSEVLILKSAPHLSAPPNTSQIMQKIFWGLLAVALALCATQGISMALVLLTATGVAVLTEHVCSRLASQPSSISNYHAAGSGLLLGLMLPASFPLWMTAVGAMVAVCAGKVMFGGLGSSLFNPAATGRVFLQACFPASITAGVSLSGLDRFTGLEPGSFTLPFLSPPQFTDLSDIDNLFVPIVIAAVGVWLYRMGLLKWRVSVPMFVCATFLAGLLHAAWPESCAGPMSLLSNVVFWLGVVFLAPEMTTSPTTRGGMWLYGAAIGIAGAILWCTTDISAGVVCAVLLGNALVPLIEFVSQPRIYGGRRWWKVETP